MEVENETFLLFLLHNLILLCQKIFRKLQQIAFNNSSHIDFMDLYKKCTEKPYSIFAIDDTLASDNPLRFRKNLLEKI